MYFFRNNDDYPEKVSPIAILLAINQLHQCRPDEMVGAHARRYNAHSIGICYEGGLDANGKPAYTRTPAQKHALITLLRCLSQVRLSRCRNHRPPRPPLGQK